MVCPIVANNQFVYKCYSFDEETGWFYLKSRYYDLRIRRFISSDDIENFGSESINGLNLNCYCLNNPVMCVDSSGRY